MPAEVKARVLVALDYSQPAREVLGNLANLLNVDTLELAGIYIEDEDLAQAALLPGAMEVSLSGVLTQLNSKSLRRDIEAQARQMQAAFEQLAHELKFGCSFHVARGRHVDELLRQAAEADFVLISRPLRAIGLRPRRAGQFAPLVAQRKNLLFVNEPWGSGRSVVVLCADSQGETDAKAIAMAARLARAENIDLVVVKHDKGAATAAPAGARVRQLDDWSETAIADLCLAEDARLLVVPAEAPLSLNDLLPRLVDRLPCSLLRLV